MKILYITSFNKILYDISGRYLIESFIEHMTEEDRLLVCYEGMKFQTENSKILLYNLDYDEYLKGWLEKNRYNIDKNNGGDATEETNPRVYTKWNMRMSNWFRKIVSLRYAKEVYFPKYLVWIDADCIIEKTIPKKKIKQTIGEFHMMYYLGRGRMERDAGVETGLVCFQKQDEKYIYLDYWMELYEGKYEKYKRWDDGYLLKKIIEKQKNKYPAIDIGISNQVNVMKYTNPFQHYVKHNKGKHNAIFNPDNKYK
jgi:hypothetical protein